MWWIIMTRALRFSRHNQAGVFDSKAALLPKGGTQFYKFEIGYIQGAPFGLSPQGSGFFVLY